jgi:hypothetical protein
MRRLKLGRAVLCAMVFSLSGLAATVMAQEAKVVSKGQTLYLPIYSQMIYGNLGKSGKASAVQLSALVSVRNVDGKRPMRVLSARYYDTHGKLLGERVPTPVSIPPFGTLELFVELNDASGGSGANFVIKWDADGAINQPMVEALHANLDGGKAVVFMTQSVPVSE